MDFSFDHLCDQFLRSLPSNRIIASLGGVVKLTELIFLGAGPHSSVSCGVCENKISVPILNQEQINAVDVITGQMLYEARDLAKASLSVADTIRAESSKLTPNYRCF